METGVLSPAACAPRGLELERSEACAASVARSLVHRLAEPALVAGLLLALTAAFAWRGGALAGEFGDAPDEAGHFVTGLMVRDYLVSGHWSDPMGFARTYYDHYPKVALGHWPPMFYVAEAAWTVIAGPSRASVILLLCSITAATGLLLYARLREPAGRVVSLGLAVALIALPLVRRLTGMVMPEMLVALFTLAALLAFERYLRKPGWKWSALFGALAAMTVMTKGNGWALGLVPPISVLFLRRFELLRRPTFWLPAAMMLVLCAPWFILTRHISHPSPTTSDFMTVAARLYASSLVGLGGGLLLALAAVGFIGRVVAPWRSGRADTLCAVHGACLISVLGFHCLINCGLEPRYLLPAAPSLLVLAAAGLDLCARRLVTQATAIGPARLAMMVCLLVSIHLLAQRPRAGGVRGLAAVADTLTNSQAALKNGLMISSDPVGEGAFIAQIALREQRPGRRILRADKILADSNWDARVYRNRFETPAQVLEQLVAAKVKMLVVDSSIPRRNRLPHHQQIKQVITDFPERWQEIGAYAATRDGKCVANALKVYRLVK